MQGNKILQVSIFSYLVLQTQFLPELTNTCLVVLGFLYSPYARSALGGDTTPIFEYFIFRKEIINNDWAHTQVQKQCDSTLQTQKETGFLEESRVLRSVV